MSDRLFVALNTSPYRDFEIGSKDVELRGICGQFNTDTVYEGRDVELRRGYSTDDSLHGEVGEVWTGDTLDEIMEQVDYKRITPTIDGEREFEKHIGHVMGDKDGWIAFEVAR